jgi:hypothetical protein
MRSLLSFTLIILIIINLLHGLQAGADSVEIENGGEVKETAKKNAKKRSSKNWSKVDFNSLEKEWEGGDDEEETESEYEKIRRVRKEKLAKSGEDQSVMSKLKKDPLGLNFGSGGSMMFAKLKTNVKWSNDEVTKIAKQWKGLLLSSGTDVNVVNIGSADEDNDGQGTILLSVDKAWWTSEVVYFALRQQETEKITLNNRDITLKDIPSEED